MIDNYLNIPHPNLPVTMYVDESQQAYISFPSLHGGYLAYHSQNGWIIAPAGPGNVYVMFEQHFGTNTYVSCPISMLRKWDQSQNYDYSR